MPASPLIFISYAGRDRALAERVHHALVQAGLRPWCDAVDLVPGDRWDEVIPRVLGRAAVVLVLVTDLWPEVGAPSTGWYGPEEIALAIDHARRADRSMIIVPVRLDGAGVERLPYGLRRLTGIETCIADPRPIVSGVIRALERRARASCSPTRPALHANLVDAEDAIARLEAAGAPRAEIDAAVAARLDIRRRLRAGGSLRPGDLLDRYVLAERLGEGGFASVWRAWDRLGDRHVALKVLHGRWNRDASKVERFYRGVQQMARARHPSVVPVIDGGREDGGWHFFVMALMRGGDLYAAITRREQPLSADEGLRALLEVADALAAAHRRGVVHRDVKPQNVLLDAEGRAYLTDFDLVRAPDTTGGTETRGMGSFLYAAPEQLDRAQDVGPRADVYALGMTAVFVLAGRQPPARCKWQPEATLAALPATEAVRACLQSAVALDESARPADAGVFRDALRQALGIGGAVSSAEHGPSTGRERIRPATRHRPAMVPVRAGAFVLGSPMDEVGRLDGEFARRVELARGFLIAETPVTQAQYGAVMGAIPAYFRGADADRPVEQVSWFDAVAYCNALSAVEGLEPAYAIDGAAVSWDPAAPGYRLPTEAEWEYAVRAGTSTATYAGNPDVIGESDSPVLDAIAWYAGNSASTYPKAAQPPGRRSRKRPDPRGSTQPVKGKLPNGWGLYDMLGNVWEWTWDRYDSGASGAADFPVAGRIGAAPGGRRVVRGGSFSNHPRSVRAAVRYRWQPGYRFHNLGFRPVRFVDPADGGR